MMQAEGKEQRGYGQGLQWPFRHEEAAARKSRTMSEPKKQEGETMEERSGSRSVAAMVGY